MRNVGFQGGSSIFEIGSSRDVDYFFCIINNEISLSEQENFFLRKVFLKYISLSDIVEFSEIINKVKEKLMQRYPDENQVWENLKCNNDIFYCKGDKLNWRKFNIYFDAINHCIESSIGFHDEFKIYKPLRIVVTDMPNYIMEKIRPLAEYDALDERDTPFWLR